MPDWRRIRKLRDELATLRENKSRKFNMNQWIAPLSSARFWSKAWNHEKGPTIGELRNNGRHCTAVACLAGWTVIFHAPVSKRRDAINPETWAATWLGLSEDEKNHAFYGEWGTLDRRDLKNAVLYLTRALEAKDMFVRI